MSGANLHYILSKVSLQDNRAAAAHAPALSPVELSFTVPIGLPAGRQPPPTVPATQILQGGTPLIGFYFGAQWCPPCRAFSPQLSAFAERHEEVFSVVFCSADRSDSQFRQFLGGKKFLAVPFASPARTQLLSHFKIQSFPTLIVVDTRTPELRVVTRWGRLAIQGESTPGSLVQQWLSGSSGLLSNKTAKLLLIPVILMTSPSKQTRDVRASMGFLEVAEAWEIQELKTGHYVHLGVANRGPRIVFLHGLSQSLDCWLPTATRLCKRDSTSLQAECLLIDLIGHGKTPVPGRDPTRVRPDVMCRQVHRVLEKIGWMDEGGRKIVLAGLSLGGAIALLWAEVHLDRVARLVRVAAAGLEEPAWGFFPAMLRCAGAETLISRVSTLTFDLSFLFSGLLAPDYGVDQRMPEILRQRGVPVSCVGGTWDYVHRTRIDRWKPSYVLLVHGWEHIRMCTCLDTLKLADRTELWVGAGSGDNKISTIHICESKL